MKISDSRRLKYRFVSDEEKQFLWEIDQDENVMKYINDGTRTSKSDIEVVILPRLRRYSDQEKGWGLWKVIRLKDDESLGWIMTRPFGFFTQEADFKCLELGWRFSKKHWGFGYASEAAKKVIEEFSLVGISEFSCIVNPSNLASIRVAEKAGMTFSHTQVYRDEIFIEEVDIYRVFVISKEGDSAKDNESS